MDDNQNKAKAIFSNTFKKVGDIGKKTVEGAKSLAEQTQKNIHEQHAKKYIPITKDEFNSDNFQVPTIIKITDDFENRKFVESEDAIGWIEHHKDVPVLHMYNAFTQSCGLTFVPFARRRYEVLTVDVTGKDPRSAVEEALPPQTAEDFYRILLTGEAEHIGASGLEKALAGRFAALEVRDDTRLPRDLWERMGEDSLRGRFLAGMRALLDGAETEQGRQRVILAVRFGLDALEHRDLS